MSGRSYNRYRGGHQDQNPRWSGNDVRNISGRNYQRDSGPRQQQYSQARMISPQGPPIKFPNYGRIETAPRKEAYNSPRRVRDVRPARPQFQRAQHQPQPRRTRSGVRSPRRGVFRKPAVRSNTGRRLLQRKRDLKVTGYRRENKRFRTSSNAKPWTNNSSGGRIHNKTSLKPSSIILASGIPGEADLHNFLDVKFLSHPFITPSASINKKTGMINIEVLGKTRHVPPDARERCEFSIMKHDIISIITVEGDKIPEDIAKCKIDLQLELEGGKKDVDSEMEQDNVEINPNGMHSEELRLELKKRGLESHGLKGELIQRLKAALAKESEELSGEGALKLQDVDPSVLFIHVDSEEVEDEAGGVGTKFSEDEHVSNSSHDPVGERNVDRSDQEKSMVNEDINVPDEHYSKLENEIDENMVQIGISSEEFSNDECYAFVSGIRGKVRKKDLTKIFSPFGKIVSIKQVARKCRIEFDSPTAVTMLINRTSPLMIDGHALLITRDPAIARGTQSKKKNNDVKVAYMETDTVGENGEDSERGHYVDEAVEVGRGTPKGQKKTMETDESLGEDGGDVYEETKGVSSKRSSSAKKKRAAADKRMSLAGKTKSPGTKGGDVKKSSSKKLETENQFDFDNLDCESVDNNNEFEDGKSIQAPGEQSEDESLLDFTDEVKEHLYENEHKPPHSPEAFSPETRGKKVQEKEDADNDIGIDDYQNKSCENPQEKSSVEHEQANANVTQLRKTGLFESAGESEVEEDSHYKDRVGLKNGMSLIEHLKLRTKSTEDRVGCEVKVSESSLYQNSTERSEEPITGEGNHETENFTCKSYRVVIALQRGVRIKRLVETLIRREALDEARIVILEFALTPKNMQPREVFTAVTNGPLNDLAHGNVWPESGSLSFKSTVTKVLKQMNAARAKEKRLCTVDALVEENKVLKEKGEELEAEIQKIKDEVVTLKKNIKKAKGFLD